MPTLTTPTLEIDYEEHGSPQGAPVLLLHGFPDAKEAWRAVVAELGSAAGGAGPLAARLIVPSLRGYGHTRLRAGHTPTGQQSALAADVLELMDGLAVERAILVGHDWGARAAYAAAVLAPERIQGLVTLATAYQFPAGPVPSLAQAQAHWYQYLFQLDAGHDTLARDPAAFGAALWRLWSPTWQWRPEELQEAQGSWQQPEFAQIVVTYYRTRFGNYQGPPEYAEKQQALDAKPPVPVPVLLAQGAEDACELLGSTEDGLERFYPAGLERTVLPGAGHFLPRERPQEIAALVREAVRRWS
jgi:pimeloyl-ACP methyl ester carboxylesterase